MWTEGEIQRELETVERGDDADVLGVLVTREQDGTFFVDGRFKLGLVAAARAIYDTQDESGG